MVVSPVKSVIGKTYVVGDKSISHRFAMLAPFCSGTSIAHGFLSAADTLSTLDCMSSLGVKYEYDGDMIVIHGDLHPKNNVQYQLNAKNSATTARLLAGLLSGVGINAKIFGDDFLSVRPMGRVTEPLRLMGASIECGGTCPILLSPATLHATNYTLKQNSAQVKSAILFAGINANGITTITQNAPMRNHSELMLKNMGANINTSEFETSITGTSPLKSVTINIPSDISSASYFVAAACILHNSHVKIKNVGINPTRMGFINALISMGANISFENVNTEYEPSADIVVKCAPLHAISILPNEIPSLIDEIPLLALCACFANGETHICGAGELRHKESNRLDAVVTQLCSVGGCLKIHDDDIVITGTGELLGGDFDTLHDHRLAMTFYVAAICAKTKSTILNADCVGISFPDFYECMKKLEVCT